MPPADPVHQRSRLQGVIASLAAQVDVRELSQFPVDRRQCVSERGVIWREPLRRLLEELFVALGASQHSADGMFSRPSSHRKYSEPVWDFSGVYL